MIYSTQVTEAEHRSKFVFMTDTSYWGYPAKRALSAMHKHGGYDPFGRIPLIYLLPPRTSYGVSIMRNLDKLTSLQYNSALNGLTHSSGYHCAPSHFRLLRSNSSILNYAWYELCRVLVKLCYVTTLTVKWHLDNLIFSGCSRFC